MMMPANGFRMKPGRLIAPNAAPTDARVTTVLAHEKAPGRELGRDAFRVGIFALCELRPPRAATFAEPHGLANLDSAPTLHWLQGVESNHRPPGYEPGALPTALPC